MKRTLKKSLFLILFTLGHSSLTVLSLAESLSYWDRPAPYHLKAVLDITTRILEFPVLVIFSKISWLGKYFPGILGCLPLLLNSFIWSLIVWSFLTLFESKRRWDRIKE